MEAYGKENIHTCTPNRNETGSTSSTPSKPAAMRPLTAAYQAARSNHQVPVFSKHSYFKCDQYQLSLLRY